MPEKSDFEIDLPVILPPSMRSQVTSFQLGPGVILPSTKRWPLLRIITTKSFAVFAARNVGPILM